MAEYEIYKDNATRKKYGTNVTLLMAFVIPLSITLIWVILIFYNS